MFCFVMLCNAMLFKTIQKRVYVVIGLCLIGFLGPTDVGVHIKESV